jgi:Zn-dependent peptidase ImmA (M78 family)
MKKNRIKSKIEYLSRTEIEERASLMLQYVFPDRSEDPNPPALKEIVTVLKSKYNVQFSFSKNLGSLPSGEKFLGMFTVNPLIIHICSSIKAWSPDFYRTLAHELGHLVLHRKMIGDGKYISKDKPIIDTAQQLRYRETAELSDLGWVEWQANEFSMCLILPRKYIQILVISAQNELGINKNLGTMYLDDQPCNKHDCKRIVDRIKELSGTQESLLWRRLRFLGILEDHQKKRMRPAFESFDALFETEEENQE